MAATKTHSPTNGMKAAAKRGVEMMKNGGWESDIPDISIKGGGMLAAGRKISDDHVRSMAEYHAGHLGNCPAGGDAEHADDLMWGGPAGASWSASRVAAMDATKLADSEPQDIDKLLGADAGCSLEIFARDGLMDRTDLKKDENGLIWAPIIRSGTLAMRPGPGGTKLHEPLVFVPGHASNSTEIGLQDLKDAFDDQAVEHVTIPKTHANDTFENTGTITALKIADSTLRPGEKVLVAGHKFTEPDVEGQVERGSILSRSCGILHNFTNTESGRTYPHVIEHVALTNRAWVPGMEPYGSDVFSQDREVVGLLLSERPTVPAPEVDPTKAPSIIFSTSTPKEELERELKLADIQWGDEPSLSQIQSQLYDTLREMGRSPDYDESSIWFDVRDVTPSKALVSVDYGGSDPADAWVIPFSLDDQGKLTLSDFAEWQPVEQQWVTDEDAAQDKSEVQAILQGGDGETSLSLVQVGEVVTYLSVSAAQRDKAHAAGHSLPDKSYPIENKKQLNSAAILAASGHGDVKAAKALIHKRAKELGVDPETLPGMGKKKTGKKGQPGNTDADGDTDNGASNMSLPQDPLKRASMLRIGAAKPATGGLMSLTQDTLARLDLSDEAREVLQREINENATRDAELKKYREQTKESGVKDRLTKLSDMGFKDCPGFLRTIEDVLRSDDGDVAIKLNLSADGTSNHETVTQVVDRIIEALPKTEEGKIALAQKGNLLENPLDRRPPLEPEKDEDPNKPLTGTELAQKWEQDLGGQLNLALAPVPGAAVPAAAGGRE